MPSNYKFISPQYRPWPLFVLNEDYDDEAGLHRLLQGLEDVKRAGFGGVFLHPRPGMLTEYLSPRWFEVITACVRKCLGLEIVPGLYDENSYPSGGAGGHTCSRRPETRARYIMPKFGSGKDLPAGSFATYQFDGKQIGERIDNPDTNSEWIAFYQAEAKIMAWHGEVPFPNLLDPLTCQTFLEATHEAYKRHLPEDVFRAIPAMFTDEPHLVADRHGPMGAGLSITPDFVVRFRIAHGYDILDHLPELYFDVAGFEAIRFDYYDFCHRLWVDSWAKPLEAWHRDNGWKLTGHYLEHNWPVPYASPGQMELLAHMDWPGTDLLCADPLGGHDTTDLQNFGPAEAGTEPHLLFILKQTHSVANQFGKQRVMNECWGAGGHASTPSDWMRMGRFLVVNGVNLLVPHHTMTSIRGTRKHDHPQFFSAQSPWFEYLPQLNDELARICQATAKGQMRNRILVLDAQTTGYCLARKSDCIDSTPPDPFTPGGVRPGERALADLRDQTHAIVQSLAEAQCDFDLGDEYLIAKHAECESNGQLKLGQQSYRLLVWPEGLSNLRSETAERLEDFLRHGGQIVGVRPERLLENGRPSARLDAMEAAHPQQLLWTESSQVASEVCKLLPPRIQVVGEATGIYHQRRETPSGVLWLVINLSPAAREVRFAEDIPANSIDLLTGDAATFSGSTLSLPTQSAHLLTEWSDAAAIEPKPAIPAPEQSGAELELDRIEASGPNALVLDRCQLSLYGETHPLLETRRANAMVWQAHGLSPAGASGTIQYRRQILDRAESLPSGSGYAMDYPFEIGNDTDLTTLRLALETPELFTVLLNGQPLDFSDADNWLDPNIRALPVGSLLQNGTNTLTLQQSPFDPRAEIAPVYLLGDFSLTPIDPGFRIDPPRALALGAWSEQGRPFFEREVSYYFKPSDQSGTVHLRHKSWHGSWLIAETESTRQQLSPGNDLRLQLQAGEGLRLKVVGLPQNLLGPWHASQATQEAGKFGCPLHWEAPFAEISARAGDDYNFLPLGLLRAPNISIP